MQVTVLHHSDAGEGDWPAERVQTQLAAAGMDGRYCSAQDEASWEIVRRTGGIVLVVGGDGTVAKAAAVLDRRKARLAILPTGGANNIARSLGVYAPPEQVLQGLAEHTTTHLHVGEMRLRGETACFVEAAGIGALTRSMQASMSGLPRPYKHPVGREALRKALLEAEPCCAAVTLDGEAMADPVLAFEFMNITRIGPGLQLASPRETDGSLAAVWLPAGSRKAMLNWLADPEASRPPVKEVRVRRVQLRLNGEPLRLDDKVQPAIDDEVTLELQEQPVRVLVPEVTP